MRQVRSAKSDEFADLASKFQDDRLRALLPLYKARNFPTNLSSEERVAWEQFRSRKLIGGKDQSRLAKFFSRLSELADNARLSDKDRFLLEELQLYGQSVMPDTE